MKSLISILLLALFSTSANSQMALGGGSGAKLQIASGAASNMQIDVLSPDRAPGIMTYAKNEYTAQAASATTNLINYSSGLFSARPAASIAGRLYLATDTTTLYRDTGSAWNTERTDITSSAGYLSAMWWDINSASGDASSMDSSTVNVYYDGNSTPDISVPTNYFIGAFGAGATTKFVTKFTSYIRTSTYANHQSRIPMPFSTGIKIDLVNGSGSNSAVIFSEVQLQLGVPNVWPNTRHYYVTTFAQTACTLGSTVNLANVTSGIGRVLFEAVYMSGGSASDQEGNVNIYVNGNTFPAYQSSGFEDNFETGNNWTNVWTTPNWVIAGGQEGVYVSTGSFPSDPVGAFRYHGDDKIVFTNGFKTTLMCGDPSEGSSGNPNINSSVGYYKQN